jgi:hypothetical protein
MRSADRWLLSRTANEPIHAGLSLSQSLHHRLNKPSVQRFQAATEVPSSIMVITRNVSMRYHLYKDTSLIVLGGNFFLLTGKSDACLPLGTIRRDGMLGQGFIEANGRLRHSGSLRCNGGG